MLTLSGEEPNFVFLVPPVFSGLARKAGWRPATMYTLVTLPVFGVVTLPFYFADPSGFPPLHALGKLSSIPLDPLRPLVNFPDARLAVPSAMSALALGLALLPMDERDVALLSGVAAVQALPVVVGLGLGLYATGSLDFRWAWYGLNFLLFGALASWLVTRRKAACSLDSHSGAWR